MAATKTSTPTWRWSRSPSTHCQCGLLGHQTIGYAGGAMIGRALTFGYLAALHASQDAV